jgi:2-C-methyl-D-erythritol 4-phosphate cytidylyltransferase
MNYYVIIAAGGIGTRMQAPQPKQFLLIHHKPILYYTISQFQKAYEHIKCIIAVPTSYINQTNTLLQQYNIAHNCTVIEGGATRYHSVQNGVNAITDTNAIVLVHDAARCLVSTQLIQTCVQQTIANGNAVPAVAITDSLRVVNNTNQNSIVDRTTMRSIQTPQTFELSILQKAFAQEYSTIFTDEASVVEQLGISINLIQGEYSNIKITNPIDIAIAQKLLQP